MSKVKRYHFESFIDSYYKHRQFVLASDYDALAVEAQTLKEEVAELRAKLSNLPGWLREIYEWGYVGGQNNPNGYIDEEDRDRCVNDLLRRLYEQ
ncbi:hypothetical protein [Pseudomonas phage K4]|nr:hypothetical protein [Pseudomonas phage IME180]QWS69978.1 hypothetical protein [Pseudomonas phage K4]